MNIPFVDLKKQYLSIKSEIDSAIFSVIEKSAFIKGSFVENFEKQYKEIYDVKNVVSCANGTDAIFIALRAIGIKQGDEVITTSHSWISTSETITLAGGKPVFVDIDKDSYTIDPNKIEEKITSKTKAIIPVHIYGQPVDMTSLMKIAKKYNLKVIEDCAQAHFAKWKGQYVGTIGDIGTFSFFPGKNLGAYGDAGCVVTNDGDLAEKMKMFSNHGALKKHHHQEEGINSRLDGIQAAVLSVKLKYIKKWTEMRKTRARYYNKLLVDIPGIQLPASIKNSKHVFHLYVIQIDERDSLQQFLKGKGVSTGIHYPTPLPFMQAYSYLSHSKTEFPLVNNISNRILSLPIFPELEDSQIEFIHNSLMQFYRK